MSSKTEAEPRRGWSLALRLTAWYAGSSFALVAAVTGFLYWALSRSLDREDDQLLADKVRVLLAVLGQDGNPAALRQEVEESQQAFQHSPVFVRIIRPDGTALAETTGMAEALPADLFPPTTDRVGPGVNLRSPRGPTFRLVAVKEPGAGRVVQVGMDRSQDDELLAEFRRFVWVALAASVVACAAVGYQIARRGLGPLRAIADTASRIGPSSLGKRLGTAGLPPELLALAVTFNAMLDRLEGSFDRLSRFSADIAHELRTPVGNLRGGIEVSLTQPRSPDQYREVLASGLEECVRLGRLIESMLFLARAENPRTQVATESLPVKRELDALAEFCEAAATEAGITLAVHCDASLTALANRPLFQRAVGNVLANALAHTPRGGGITLSARREGDAVAVEVADTGRGIAPEHLPHVFERFYRADPVRSSPGGSVGLGLAIVRSIVELHGGAAAIDSAAGRGTRVTLTFPAG